jgi:hypothetical protein
LLLVASTGCFDRRYRCRNGIVWNPPKGIVDLMCIMEGVMEPIMAVFGRTKRLLTLRVVVVVMNGLT